MIGREGEVQYTENGAYLDGVFYPYNDSMTYSISSDAVPEQFSETLPPAPYYFSNQFYTHPMAVTACANQAFVPYVSSFETYTPHHSASTSHTLSQGVIESRKPVRQQISLEECLVFKKENPAKAIDMLNKLIKQQPSHWRAMYELAHLVYQTKYNRSQALFRKAFTILSRQNSVLEEDLLIFTELKFYSLLNEHKPQVALACGRELLNTPISNIVFIRKFKPLFNHCNEHDLRLIVDKINLLVKDKDEVNANKLAEYLYNIAIEAEKQGLAFADEVYENLCKSFPNHWKGLLDYSIYLHKVQEDYLGSLSYLKQAMAALSSDVPWTASDKDVADIHQTLGYAYSHLSKDGKIKNASQRQAYAKKAHYHLAKAASQNAGAVSALAHIIPASRKKCPKGLTFQTKKQHELYTLATYMDANRLEKHALPGNMPSKLVVESEIPKQVILTAASQSKTVHHNDSAGAEKQQPSRRKRRPQKKKTGEKGFSQSKPVFNISFASDITKKSAKKSASHNVTSKKLQPAIEDKAHTLAIQNEVCNLNNMPAILSKNKKHNKDLEDEIAAKKCLTLPLSNDDLRVVWREKLKPSLTREVKVTSCFSSFWQNTQKACDNLFLIKLSNNRRIR